MKIGDIVQRIPETFGETEIVQAKDRKQPKKERKPFTGTVTYIHPLRRYHVVRQKAAEEGAQAIHGDGDVHPPTEEIPRRQLPGARRRHPRELRRRMRQTTA